MSLLGVVILLLFVGIGGYGLYASIFAFFLAGATGCVTVIVNLTTENKTLKSASYYLLLGSLIYAAIMAAVTFF